MECVYFPCICILKPIEEMMRDSRVANKEEGNPVPCREGVDQEERTEVPDQNQTRSLPKEGDGWEQLGEEVRRPGTEDDIDQEDVLASSQDNSLLQKGDGQEAGNKGGRKNDKNDMDQEFDKPESNTLIQEFETLERGQEVAKNRKEDAPAEEDQDGRGKNRVQEDVARIKRKK